MAFNVDADAIAQLRDQLNQQGLPLLESLAIPAGEGVFHVKSDRFPLDPEGYKFVTWMAVTDGDGKRTGERVRVAFPAGLHSEFVQVMTSYKHPRAHAEGCDVSEDIPSLQDMVGPRPPEGGA